MKTVFKLLLIVALLSSCKTKKNLSYSYNNKDESEIIYKEKLDSLYTDINNDIIINEDLDKITITTTVTEFEIISDSVSGNIKSVPKKTTIITKTAENNSKTTIDKSKKINTNIDKNSDVVVKNDIKTEEKISAKKSFSNTAIVKWFYLFIAIIVGGIKRILWENL